MKRLSFVGEDLIKKGAAIHQLLKVAFNTDPHNFNELQKNIVIN
jgi:hypothetical protein